MLALAHDDPPVTNHRAHIARPRVIHQTGRHTVQRKMVRPAQIDQDNIGQLANSQLTQLMGLAIHASAVARGQRQRLRDTQLFGVAQQLLLSHSRQAHGFPEVKRVVADRAVRAQADRDAQRPQLDQIVEAHSQLGVGLGAVGDADRRAEISQDLQIARRGAQRMRQDSRHVEDATSVEDLDGRLAAALQAGLGLAQRLGGVDVDAAADGPGFGGAGAQKIVIAGIRRVRRQNRADAPAGRPVPALRESRRLVNLAQAAPAEHRLPEQGAGPGYFDRARGVLHVPVMVVDCGDAGFDHLQQAQLHAPIDIFGFQIGFQMPDIIVEPAFQVDVFAQAAPKRHRHVGMRVDEAGHGDLAGGVEHDLGMRRVAGSGRLHRLDTIAADENIAPAEQLGPLRLDLQNVRVSNQQVSHRQVLPCIAQFLADYSKRLTPYVAGKSVELIAAQPTPEQAAHFAGLAQIASDDFFTVLFGSRANAALEAMFLLPHNDNSHSHTTFLLHDEAIAGMLHAYPASDAKARAWRTAWLYLRFARWQALRALAVGIRLSGIVDFIGGNLQPEDFYIAMLALYPACRGRGYGKRLLQEAERLAQAGGCTRLTLDVEAGNTVARGVYAAAGFRQIDASDEVRLGGEAFRLLRLAKPVERAG